MDREIYWLREAVEQTESRLEEYKRQLDMAVKMCSHHWEDPVYDPIQSDGYTIPGDTPGSMGVDWRGPVDVPPSTKDRWSRECSKCGEVQCTSQADDRVTKIPKF